MGASEANPLDDAMDRRLAEAVPDFLCVCRDERVLHINLAGARMLGAAAPAELVGRPFADFIHPDFQAIAEVGLAELAEDAEETPLMLQRLDGKTVEVILLVSPVSDAEDGALVAVHARDVTERSRTADSLLRSETRYRRLVELALDFTCICTGGLVTFMNPAGARLLGAPSAADLIGRPLIELVHSDYRDIVAFGLENLVEEGPLPLKLRRLDGAAVDVETAVMPLGEGGEPIFMMEARDITERKRSAEALREREQRLQGIMDGVAEGILTADERGIVQSVNPATERIFGYKAAEMVGQPLSMLMPEPDASAHDGYVAEYLRTGRAKILGVGREARGLRQDGVVFPLEINVTELKQGRNRLFIGIVRDITERKRTEEDLRRARDELESRVEERTRELSRLTREMGQILNSAGDAILGVSASGRINFANPAAAATTGWSVAEMVGRSLGLLLSENEDEDPRTVLYAKGGDRLFVHRDGSPFPVELAGAPIEENGQPAGAVVVFRDVTERRRAEESLKLAAKVFETISEGIIVTDAEYRVTAVNPAFAQITGYSFEDMFGRTPTCLEPTGSTPDIAETIRETVRTTGRWEGELWNRRKDGSDYAERLAFSAITDDSGAPVQYVIVFSDITQRKQDEERIRYQANYDSLTGLPNRALFMDRLNQSVSAASRSDQRVGLMFIDLDGFKLVNDTLGHDVGDGLLKESGKRLLDCVRTGDTVARLGGDEFTIIMPNLRDIRNAPVIAQRIISSLEQPFVFGGQEAFVSASIGITAYPDDAQDTVNLLKNADAAMYRAKEQGKANYQFFTQELNADANERLVIKNRLSKALERGEFTLYYQPKVSLADGSITSVEALLRWRNADLGMISPTKFIPVMEETGLIGAVGEWAIEVACLQHREWAEAGHPLRIAVNLSVRQLRQADLAKTVARLLAGAGIPPAGLELEITESMIMKDTEQAVSILSELDGMGVRLAMDDFGTGYSSLSYLKRFPLHTIKIDRSFVRDIGSDPDDLEIIRTIVSMGHSLRRCVVAEGVETEEQKALLSSLRCDEIQGYLVSAPVPAAEITRMLEERRSWP